VETNPCSEKPLPVRVSNVGDTSRNDIVRNTLLIGIGSVCNLIAGLFRTKVIALILGPGGVGLFGAYGAIVNLLTIIGSFGISNSGVRQMALSANTGNSIIIARTAKSIQIAGVFFGVLGTITNFALSPIISKTTFGSNENSKSVAILGVAILLGSIAASKLAVIQGLRKIKAAAKANIVGTVVGTILGLPLVWYYKENGVIFALIAVPVGMLFSTSIFLKECHTPSARVSTKEIKRSIGRLITHGVPFTISTLLIAGANWFVIAIILKNQGLEVAGQFTAASTISSIYVGFLLNAMASDLHARLSCHTNDLPAINQIVNHQTDVALALAFPGLVFTIVFADKIIGLLYAESFVPAASIIKWQIIGALGKVISHPMAYIQLARGRMGVFLLTELVNSAVYLLFIYFGGNMYGVQGLGFAYAGSYTIYTVMMLLVSRSETGFQWSVGNRTLLKILIPTIVITVLLPELKNSMIFLSIKILILTFSIWMSFEAIFKNKLERIRLWQILTTAIKRSRR
jgi:antigen flippase